MLLMMSVGTARTLTVSVHTICQLSDRLDVCNLISPFLNAASASLPSDAFACHVSNDADSARLIIQESCHLELCLLHLSSILTPCVQGWVRIYR